MHEIPIYLHLTWDHLADISNIRLNSPSIPSVLTASERPYLSVCVIRPVFAIYQLLKYTFP
jgi:hypothetical protein